MALPGFGAVLLLGQSVVLLLPVVTAALAMQRLYRLMSVESRCVCLQWVSLPLCTVALYTYTVMAIGGTFN